MSRKTVTRTELCERCLFDVEGPTPGCPDCHTFEVVDER